MIKRISISRSPLLPQKKKKTKKQRSIGKMQPTGTAVRFSCNEKQYRWSARSFRWKITIPHHCPPISITRTPNFRNGQMNFCFHRYETITSNSSTWGRKFFTKSITPLVFRHYRTVNATASQENLLSPMIVPTVNNRTVSWALMELPRE